MALFSPDHSDGAPSPELFQEYLRKEPISSYGDLRALGEDLLLCFSEATPPYVHELQVLLQVFTGKVKTFLEGIFHVPFSYFRLLPFGEGASLRKVEDLRFGLSFRNSTAMEQWSLLDEVEYHRFLMIHEQEVESHKEIHDLQKGVVRATTLTLFSYHTLLPHLEAEVDSVSTLDDVLRVSARIGAFTERALLEGVLENDFFAHLEALYERLLKQCIPESTFLEVHFAVGMNYSGDEEYVDLSQLVVYENGHALCTLNLAQQQLVKKELQVLQEAFATITLLSYEDVFFEIDRFLERFLEQGYFPVARVLPSSLEVYRSCLISRLETYLAHVLFREEVSLTLHQSKGMLCFTVYTEQEEEVYTFFPTRKSFFDMLQFFHHGCPVESWEVFQEQLFTVNEVKDELQEIITDIPYPSLEQCEAEDFHVLEESLRDLFEPYLFSAPCEIRILFGGHHSDDLLEYNEHTALVLEALQSGYVPLYDSPEVLDHDQYERQRKNEEEGKQYSIGLLLTQDHATHISGEIIAFLPFTYEEGEFSVTSRAIFDFLVRITSLSSIDHE